MSFSLGFLSGMDSVKGYHKQVKKKLLDKTVDC
jgi:hypothetical protein